MNTASQYPTKDNLLEREIAADDFTGTDDVRANSGPFVTSRIWFDDPGSAGPHSSLSLLITIFTSLLN
jgi:hypothetical protein